MRCKDQVVNLFNFLTEFTGGPAHLQRKASDVYDELCSAFPAWFREHDTAFATLELLSFYFTVTEFRLLVEVHVVHRSTQTNCEPDVMFTQDENDVEMPVTPADIEAAVSTGVELPFDEVTLPKCPLLVYRSSDTS